MSPLEFQNLYSPISGRAAGNGSAGGRGTAGLGGLERRSESNEEARIFFWLTLVFLGLKCHSPRPFPSLCGDSMKSAPRPCLAVAEEAYEKTLCPRISLVLLSHRMWKLEFGAEYARAGHSFLCHSASHGDCRDSY